MKFEQFIEKSPEFIQAYFRYQVFLYVASSLAIFLVALVMGVYVATVKWHRPGFSGMVLRTNVVILALIVIIKLLEYINKFGEKLEAGWLEGYLLGTLLVLGALLGYSGTIALHRRKVRKEANNRLFTNTDMQASEPADPNDIRDYFQNT